MGKSTSSTTTNAPPQWLQDSLQSFLGGAQGLLGGNPKDLVAGFNDQQNQAFANINKLANGKFNQKDIDRYMSPYLNDVVDATQKQLDLNDAQQQNQLSGNVASSGAFGGDRQAVLQSQLAGQQDAANNATISGLYNTGYNNALSAYQTANQQQLGAAEAQLGAGTMQQQNAQQILDVPYQQYDFLGNLYGDLGGLFGGSSTTKQSMPFSLADGGRAGHYDDGGVTRNIFMPFGGGSVGGQGGRAQLNVHGASPPPPSGGGLMSGIGDLSKLNGSLKGLGIDTGIGPASGAGAAASAAAPASAAAAAPGWAGLTSATGATAAADAGATAAGSGGIMDAIASLAALFKDGGSVNSDPFAAGPPTRGKTPRRALGGILGLATPQSGMLGILPQKLDDGGNVEDLPDTSIVDATGQVIPAGASAMTADQTPDSWRGVATHYAPPAQDQGGWAGMTSATGAASPSTDPTWSNGEPVVKGKGLADASSTPSGMKPGYYDAPTEKPSPWMAVATGVLGALANRSFSKGALMGLQEYHNEELEQNPTVDHSGTTVHVRYNGPGGRDLDTGIPTEAALNASAMQNYRTDALQTRQDSIAAENARAAASLEEQKQAHADAEANRKAQLRIAYINAGQPVPAELEDAPTSSAPAAGGQDLFTTFATKMQAAENGTGNPAAKNPLSSATGNGQFIDQTWLSMLKSVNPQIASTLTPQQQLALRSDPAFSNEMTVAYAKQNGQALTAASQPVTASTLALAHRFGPQGALSILNAPATAPLASILPPAVIKANPTLANKTAGQYAQAISAQFGNAPVGGAAPASSQSSFIPPKFLSEPKLISGIDAHGAPQQVLAQQDQRNGQWITADQNRTPVNLTNMQISSSGGGSMGNRAEVYFNRVVNAGNEVAAAARNIMELPSISSTGVFGGRSQGPSLFDAAKENLTNTLSTQDTQAYNTMIAGVTRGLAAIESAGLAPSGSLMHSMDSVILKEGDTVETKMRKMAEMRQIVEKGLEPNLANPKIPPEQKKLVQGIIDQIGHAIPFTQHDITMLDQAKNPTTTLAQIAAQRNLGTSKQAAGAPKFENGKVYKDKNGNRAVYNNGHWTPTP